MNAIWLVARAELRGRPGSLLAVAGLVALVTGVVLASLSAAQRSATSVDRYREWTGASDVTFQAESSEVTEVLLAAVRSAPEADVATRRILVNAFPTDGMADLAVMSDPDGRYGSDVDAPLLLEGRMPVGDDEILLNEMAARVSGLAVGDRIELATWSTDDLVELFTGPNFPGFNGPRLDLEVVGVGRTPEELTGDVRRTAPIAIAAPGFLAAHPGIGAWPPAVVVRARNGAGDLPALDQVVAAARAQAATDGSPAVPYQDVTTAGEVYLDTSHRTVRSIAIGLLLLAAASAAAGALAIGQAVQRQLAGSASPHETLRALGLSPNEIATALTVPVALVGAAGALAGVALAIAATARLTLGLAARAEVDPGVWVAPGILAVGWVAAVVLVALGCFLAARRRSVPAPAAARARSRLGAVAGPLRAGPTAAAGLRLATERGRGIGAVPLRSSLVGLTIAVAAVVAAGITAVGFDELESTPTRWGWPWSSTPDYFGSGEIAELEARLVQDERLDAVARYRVDTLVIDGEGVTSSSLEQLRGSMVMVSTGGRLPAGPSEIALARGTMSELGVSIGDAVTAVRPAGAAPVTLTVVGTVVLPPTDEYSLDAGALLTPDGLEAAGSGDSLQSIVLRYPDGADVAALEALLAEDYGFQFGIFTSPSPPGAVRNLVEARNIAIWLAALFVALALIGLLHALVVSTRRRREDLAVLRVLGFRRGEVRRSVAAASLSLVLGAVIIGVPLGAAVGRLVWRELVSSAGALSGSETPWLVIALLPPVAAASAVLVAWWPGLRAVRLHPAEQLRAE